jgi:response regulator RpfG family c-di-GMP phosphodiesterase
MRTHRFSPKEALHTRYYPSQSISASDALLLPRTSPMQGIGSFLKKASSTVSNVTAKATELQKKAEAVAKQASQKSQELQKKAEDLANKAVETSQKLHEEATKIQSQAEQAHAQYQQAKEQVASIGQTLATSQPATTAIKVASDIKSVVAPAQYLRKHSRRSRRRSPAQRINKRRSHASRRRSRR